LTANKKYTLALDVSPSEQFSGDLHAIKTMGVVVGLVSSKSFQEVGMEFPDSSHRLRLRKWAGAKQKYRTCFVEHMAKVVSTNRIICGFSHSNDANIIGAGGVFFQRYFGKFLDPSSFNKWGKPRIRLGGNLPDGRIVPPFEVISFDLCTIGWIADEVMELLRMIDRVNGEKCSLDVIADRLPNEQGGENYYLSTILHALLYQASESRVVLVGVPDPSVVVQRELFVDNVAGLANHCEVNPNSALTKLVRNQNSTMFGIKRDQSGHYLGVLTDWLASRAT
jgi:hypothetical protein